MKTSDVSHVHEILSLSAECHGDCTALRYAPDPGHAVSYSELESRARLGAACLRHHDSATDKPVLLLMEPCPDWVASFFSILAAGKVVVPVADNTPADHVAVIAAHTGIETAILGHRTQRAAQALAGCRLLYPGDLFDGGFLAPDMPPASRDLAVLAFTSGSTREPRAVELTHANLLSNLYALRSVREVGPGDVFLSLLPPTHLFEMMVGMLGPLLCGAGIVYAGTQLPNRILDCMRNFGITHALAVPALVDCLYREVVFELAEAGIIAPERSGQCMAETARRLQNELSADALARVRAGTRSRIGDSLHTLAVGGAAIAPAYARVLRAVGVRLELGYGLTEASPVVSIGLACDCPDGSVGKPLPNVDVRIDETGEILVKGPSVMERYYGDPSTSRDFLCGGWLRTGDRGRLDAEGYLFVEGRVKESMVTGAGETVFPEDIEPYYRHPIVAESCVAALPGADGNDIPTLFVVPASRDITDRQLADAFRAMKRQAPARYRAQGMVRLDHPLPRTATGKVRRRLVANTFEERRPTPTGRPQDNADEDKR